mmetsp:Transcript_9214/g.18674  ORF Transcript_9214/g.18674 Transcript_9214/m.18674 type:complete len:658 (-) Transcript_9214:376-2349(-)
MSDVDDPSSSSGEESHASDSSSYSNDRKVTMHLYLYQNEQQQPSRYHKYDGPSLQSALQLLNHDDPNFKFVKILISDDDREENTALKSLDDVISAGRAIAKSATVENLGIMGNHLRSNEFDDGSNILLFLKEMKGNRSIRHVELDIWDVELDVWDAEEFGEKMLRELEPFLKNNPNLKSFVVEHCRICHDALCLLMVALMNRDSPLGSIELNCCYVDDEAVKFITYFFTDNPKMTPRKISLACNDISDVGYFFLSEVIGNDECKLEEISLIGNDSCGLTGIRSIVSAAAGREIPMKKLDFPADFMADTPDQLQEFVEFYSAFPAFVPNCTQFYCGNFEVSRDALHALGNMLAKRSSPIRALHFNVSSIESDGIVTFLRTFLENHIATPNSIRIGGYSIRRVSVGDLHVVLGPLLQSCLCSLESLTLSDIGQISDNEMIHITSSLDGNTTLKRLDLYDRIPSACVVDRLTSLLCDETTIMSTYNSNHTLKCIKINDWIDETICSYLELNKKYPEEGLVATAKIIKYHFAHNFQLGNFESMEASLLAQIVSYVNRGFQVCDKAFFKERLGRNVNGDRANNNLIVNFLMVRYIPAFLNYNPAHPTRTGRKPPPPSPPIGEVSIKSSSRGVTPAHISRRLPVGVITRMRRSRRRGMQSSGC